MGEHRADVLILGAGLTGLAAAGVLGDRATVLEREGRPGGLVRTERFGDYWFDHVVHLLYFPDGATEARVRALVGEDLKPCPPVAWVESLAGVTRFPFQMHLGTLPPDVVVRCLTDLARVTFGPRDDSAIENFEQMLLRTFGRGMCDAFLLPYNRKMWRRPLDGLLPGGFTWNITRPDFAGVVRGAVAGGAEFAAYNSAGWYPRPPAGAPVRGMEVLSRALARVASDLRLRHTVTGIDLDRRSVTTRDTDGRELVFEYGASCLSTLPLPGLLGLCRQAPAGAGGPARGVRAADAEPGVVGGGQRPRAAAGGAGALAVLRRRGGLFHPADLHARVRPADGPAGRVGAAGRDHGPGRGACARAGRTDRPSAGRPVEGWGAARGVRGGGRAGDPGGPRLRGLHARQPSDR